MQLLLRAGEAMGHGIAQLAATLPHHGAEVRVRIALMQEHRLLQLRRELQLTLKSKPLCRRRGKIAEVVQPALADGHDLGPLTELAQLLLQWRIELGGMVRVQAGSGKQPARMSLRKSNGLLAGVRVRSGDDHLHDTGPGSARHDGLAVGIEAVMREIDADVDERWGTCRSGGDGAAAACDIFEHARMILQAHQHPMDSYHKVRELSRCARCGIGKVPVAAAASRRRPRARRISGWLAICVAISCGGWRATALAATEFNWLDIESRIQYAYYTQDTRALQREAALLAAAEGGGRDRNYYHGLANYRLTQLSGTRERAAARQAAQQCVTSLDQVLTAQRDDPDALALHAACLEYLAGLEAWRAPLAATRSGAEGERAKQLAPHNPRALLLSAVADYEHAKPGTPARDEALNGLRRAASAFEEERQQPEHTPGWGAAEVYVYLARGYFEKGAALQARDALERALLLAPEYLEARQLMSKLTS